MKTIALSEMKDDLSKLLRMAQTEEVVITWRGKPAGVVRGFANADDWVDYRLENDPRFLARVKRARAGFGAGKGIRIEEVRKEIT